MEKLDKLIHNVPSSELLERYVLGMVMRYDGSFEQLRESLKGRNDFFHSLRHRHIYDAINYVFENSTKIDYLLVKEELERNKLLEQIGGVEYLAECVMADGTSANLSDYIQRLLDLFVRRELISVGDKIRHEAYEGQALADELMNNAEEYVFNLGRFYSRDPYLHISEMLPEVVSLIKLARKNRELGIPRGVATGFYELDELTGGWQKSNLIILAARPGTGKTAMALNLAINAASNIRQQTPVAFFSMEMRCEELAYRLLSLTSGVGLGKILDGNLNDKEMDKIIREGVDFLMGCPIFFDDEAGLNMFNFRSKCRRLVVQENVGMIIVDYLQLMRGHDRAMNREQEISKISREMKTLAKELNVPIIALSQLNRNSESRGGGRPMLSDLRESGAIEQDADLVMFLSKPDYHNTQDGDLRENNRDTILVDLTIAKHRNGQTGEIRLHFQGAYQKFTSNNPNIDLLNSSSNVRKFDIDDIIPSKHDGTDEVTPF